MQDLQDVFYPKFAAGLTQSERERLGDVWDWNKPAIKNHEKIPRPKMAEHTLLMMMQARCFIVVSQRAGVRYWVGCVQIPQAEQRLDCLRLVNVLPQTLGPVDKSLQEVRSVIAAVDAILQNRSFACLLRAMLAFVNW